jgi:hypothetical protein
MDRLADFQSVCEQYRADPAVEQARLQAAAAAAQKNDPGRAAQQQEARQFNSASSEIARDITSMQAKLGRLGKSKRLTASLLPFTHLAHLLLSSGEAKRVV